jgi:uncharacterized membrane protein
MDWDDWAPWLTILTVVACGLAIRALIEARAVGAMLRALTEKISTLDQRLTQLDERFQAAAAFQPPDEAPIAPIAVQETVAAPPTEPAPTGAPAAPAAQPPAVPTAPEYVPLLTITGTEARRIEKLLVENWLVWLGGIALALGGAFLVKLSIDQGWLTPIVRVVLGVLLGFGLSAAAEWVSRREPPDEAEQAPFYIPAALAAAGASTIFASLYAAHQLYGLLPSPLAFALLALTAGATVGVSLRHGPFVAALGLIGAFAVPLLVESEAPHALPLFVYLTVVAATSLAILRHRDWNWLAWIWLGGSTFWVLLWLATSPTTDAAVLGGFLLGQLGLFAALRRGLPRIGFLAGISDRPIVRIVTRTAFWVIVTTIFVLVHADGFGTTSLVCALGGAVFLLWFAYRETALDDVIAAAAALPLALLASWDLPAPAQAVETVLRALPPEQVTSFTTFALISAVLLGGTLLTLPRVARPGRWAALSAAAPLLILTIAYWRLKQYQFDIAWSTAALLLGVLELGAAAYVARRRTGDTEIEIALAAYTVGVLGATILAATFALSNAWLTVALALHLPALGWVEGRIRLPVLRYVALGIAAAVLVRLALNPEILAYPLSERPIFNWLLYGYGVPTLAFIVATRQFGSRADDLLVRVLEAGSIVFGVLLVTLELRHFFYGRINAPLQSLARDSVQTIAWLGMAAILLRLGERRARPVLVWGATILFAVASAQAVLWQAIIANPLLTGTPVGQTLFFDALSVAYGLPAILYGVIAWTGRGPKPLAWTARILTVGLVFLWLTLEVRHAFRGEVLTWGHAGDAEWYAYSTAWLIFAGIALAIGLIWRNEWLRRAALVGIALVVAKVFLSDMAELSGALRALSFLGLGGALVGIGYAYRRLRPLQAE